jgi:DNA-directed RNA polymerase I subunit RPA2
MMMNMTEDASDLDCGRELLDQYIFVHLESNEDKFNLLMHMLRKLYAFAAGDCAHDNADAVMNHEILLTGHLFTTMVKEKLEEFLTAVKINIVKDLRTISSKVNLNDSNYFKKVCDRQFDIGQKIYYFLATGNLVSTSGLDLMQVSGFTVVAEKLNYFRYLSHFRSVHRGQFFTEMKTTTVRKLLPGTTIDL